jgi:hypothetical protein
MGFRLFQLLRRSVNILYLINVLVLAARLGLEFDQGQPVVYTSVWPAVGGNRRVFDQGISNGDFYDAYARRF